MPGRKRKVDLGTPLAVAVKGEIDRVKAYLMKLEGILSDISLVPTLTTGLTGKKRGRPKGSKNKPKVATKTTKKTPGRKKKGPAGEAKPETVPF